MLPFSRDQFFEVFERYNEAVWPAQLALVAIALGCVVMTIWGRSTSRAIGWLLAVLWAWMAIAYHFWFFASINRAAWIFGGLFLATAIVFALQAARGTLAFEPSRDASGVVGVALVLYALVGYPLVGIAAGQAYPRFPTFGLPCPTTIFTLGMLLLVRRPVPFMVFAGPFAWALVGSSAAFLLGVVEDLGLAAAAVLAACVLGLRRRGAALAHDVRRRAR
jgi:hypothetical protein